MKWGTKFGPEYVNRLYKMVEKNLTIPHRFVCFTDNTDGLIDGIETRELPPYLFRKEYHRIAFTATLGMPEYAQFAFLQLARFIGFDRFVYTEILMVVNRPWYHLAYSQNNVALYGSICLTYNENARYTSDHGVYMLRTSGYSRFAGKYAPKNGTVGDVLAIYQIYSKYTDYLGGENDYSTYQLAVNRIEDVEFDMEPKEAYPAWSAHIKWAEDNFPNYVYPAPGVLVPTDEEHDAAVAAWKAQYEANKPENDGSPLWAAWNEWADWVVWVLSNTTKDAYLLPQQIVEDVDTIE